MSEGRRKTFCNSTKLGSSRINKQLAACSNGNQRRDVKTTEQRLPAKWQKHASSRESVSKPQCVFSCGFTHTNLLAATVPGRNIYLYAVLISTFGKKDSVGRDDVRHQFEPAAVTFRDHKSHTAFISSNLFIAEVLPANGNYVASLCVVIECYFLHYLYITIGVILARKHLKGFFYMTSKPHHLLPLV